MRTLVMGDVHGNIRALEQVMERSGYDPMRDRLVLLGDYVDGWDWSKEVVERLSALPQDNVLHIVGNHDLWMLDWMRTGRVAREWYTQGGEATLRSYGAEESFDPSVVPASHRAWLERAKRIGRAGSHVFMHGGWPEWEADPTRSILAWDRSMWQQAKAGPIVLPILAVKHIWIGHTQVQGLEPETRHNVTNVDTRAGWDGVLTMMDVDTREVWQSEDTRALYGRVNPRLEGQ